MMIDSKIVEAVARAIYDAPNGIDGDQVSDMLYEDERITGANAEECRAQTMAVCRSAARAAIAAHEAALMAAGMVIVPIAVPPPVVRR